MAKKSTISLMNSIKAMTPWPSNDYSKYIEKNTKKAVPWKHHTYEYKNTKDIKKGTKYTKSSKMTNSGKSTKKQSYTVKTPYNDTAKGKKVDKLMHFHLNMNYGSGIENTSRYFDRLYSVYPERELTSVCQYVFIVRPDLNFYADNDKDGTTLRSYSAYDIKQGYVPATCPADDQFIRYMQTTNPNLMRALTSKLGGKHDFIPFLVGRTESLQLPDYTLKDYKVSQPYTGYSLPYASHALESTTGGQFEITFREDAYMRVHHLFSIWTYYIDAVTRNKLGPKFQYIRENKMDYATSVYCITCAADATRIIHWAKYTGAFPTSVPNSDMSFNLRGQVNNQVTIPFDYFLAEAMNPLILLDFNKNAHVNIDKKSEAYIPVYHSGTLNDIGMKDLRSEHQKKKDSTTAAGKVTFHKNAHISLGSGNGLVGCPFVCKVKNKNNKRPHYELRWKTIRKDISGK